MKKLSSNKFSLNPYISHKILIQLLHIHYLIQKTSLEKTIKIIKWISMIYHLLKLKMSKIKRP